MKRSWNGGSRFDDSVEDPQSSLVNLVDIMLVFICGLIVALVSGNPELVTRKNQSGTGKKVQVVEQGRELAEIPDTMKSESSGAGMESLGQVFRDPKTGKLILVGQ
jgi:hypothetical protein